MSDPLWRHDRPVNVPPVPPNLAKAADWSWRLLAVGAALFAVVSGVVETISAALSGSPVGATQVALFVNAAAYLVSAGLIATLREFPKNHTRHVSAPSVLRQIVEGWRFVGGNAVVRGLVVGRTLLYPADDDVAAAVDTAASMVR